MKPVRPPRFPRARAVMTAAASTTSSVTMTLTSFSPARREPLTRTHRSPRPPGFRRPRRSDFPCPHRLLPLSHGHGTPSHPRARPLKAHHQVLGPARRLVAQRRSPRLAPSRAPPNQRGREPDLSGVRRPEWKIKYDHLPFSFVCLLHIFPQTMVSAHHPQVAGRRCPSGRGAHQTAPR